MEDRSSPQFKKNANKFWNVSGASDVHPCIAAKVWIEVPEGKVIEKVLHRYVIQQQNACTST